jgi:circadian clock protein KaiC
VVEAAGHGERSVIYSFDERPQTIFQRAEGLGLDLARHVASGLVEIRHVDPAELTPGEFAEEVRQRCAEDAFGLVVLDTLNAYVYAMPEERLLTLHLHELVTFLSSQRVTTILLGTQHGLLQEPRSPVELDVSYLADTVVHFRPFESHGRLRKSIVVYKRRAGENRSEVRELLLGPEGIGLGERIRIGPAAWSELEDGGDRDPDHGRER